MNSETLRVSLFGLGMANLLTQFIMDWQNDRANTRQNRTLANRLDNIEKGIK